MAKRPTEAVDFRCWVRKSEVSFSDRSSSVLLWDIVVVVHLIVLLPLMRCATRLKTATEEMNNTRL